MINLINDHKTGYMFSLSLLNILKNNAKKSFFLKYFVDYINFENKLDHSQFYSNKFLYYFANSLIKKLY